MGGGSRKSYATLYIGGVAHCIYLTEGGWSFWPPNIEILRNMFMVPYQALSWTHTSGALSTPMAHSASLTFFTNRESTVERKENQTYVRHGTVEGKGDCFSDGSFEKLHVIDPVSETVRRKHISQPV